MPLVWLAPSSQWAQSSACSREDRDRSSQCKRPCCSADSHHASPQKHMGTSFPRRPGTEAPCPVPAHDPDVSGRTVLVVLPGGPGRRRLLRSMAATGAQLLCYAQSRCATLATYVEDQDWILGPADDIEGALASVRAWLAAPGSPRHIHATLCYNEFGLELCAHLAEALIGTQVTAMPLWTAEAARSKRAFRRACASANLPCPRFVRLTSPETTRSPEQLQAVLQAAGMGLPVVVKPSSCAGSFSVLRADTLEQLGDAIRGFWDRLPSYLATSKLGNHSLAATDGLLIEELLQGQEVDIDCIVFKGQLLFAAISDNHPCKSGAQVSAFVEAGGCCPSLLPDAAQEQLLRLAANVIGLFGTALSGVLHFEAMYCRARQAALPIELNARIGGGETFTNVLSAWGVDLAHAALRIACGLRPLLPPHLEAAAGAGTALVRLGRGANGPACAAGQTAKPLLQTAAGRPAAEEDKSRTRAALPRAAAEQPPLAVTGASSSPAAERARASPGPADSGSSVGSAQTTVTSTACSGRGEMECCGACLGGRGASRPEGCPWALWTLLEAAAPGVCRCSALAGTLAGCRCRGCQAAGPAGARDGRCSGGAEGRVGCCRGGAQKQGAAGWEAGSKQAQEDCLRSVAPLRWVDSINFVPEWSGAGVVERMDVGPEARGDAAFVDCELYVVAGDTVQLPPLGFSALGWMVVQGPGPEEAGQAMSRLLRHVCIELREPA